MVNLIVDTVYNLIFMVSMERIRLSILLAPVPTWRNDTTFKTTQAIFAILKLLRLTFNGVFAEAHCVVTRAMAYQV